ncbi:Tumor protein D52, partial [Paragonimus heterotremus]
VEDDIQTLKATLTIKVRRANEIRKRLGQTTLSTLQYDFMEGIHKIEDTEAFIKTSEFLGKAKDKTLTVAQETKEKVGSTITAIKNSSTVKTLSESVGSTYETVKSALIHSTYGHPPDD